MAIIAIRKLMCLLWGGTPCTRYEMNVTFIAKREHGVLPYGVGVCLRVYEAILLRNLAKPPFAREVDLP